MYRIALWNKIGSKVLFTFLIAIIPLVGVIASLNYSINHDALEQARNLLCRAVFEAAAEQDGIIAELREMLRQVAALPETRALAIAPLTATLRRVRQEKPYLANVFVCNAAGAVVASAMPGYVGKNASPRKYIKDALARGGFAFGQYVVSSVTSHPVMHFSLPVRDQTGQIAGVLVAALDLDCYSQVFKRLGVPQGGFLDLYDCTGARLLRYPSSTGHPTGQGLDEALARKLFGRQAAGSLVEPGATEEGSLLAYRQLTADNDDSLPYGAIVVGMPVGAALREPRRRMLFSSLISAGSVVAAVIVAVLLGRVVIVGRLRVLADLVADLEQDRVCLLPGDFGNDEIGRLGRLFVGISHELHEKNEKLAEAMDHLCREKERLEAVVAQLGEAQAELVRRANFDALTGLRNRRSFNERLRGEFARWRRYGTPVSLLLLDIDDFKRVNDTFGHWAGDEALRAVASRIQNCLRGTDEAYRVGGEEFALILPQTLAEEALKVAERVRAAVAEPMVSLSDGGGVRLTVSLGLAQSLTAMPAPKDFYTASDKALYQAKARGKNRVEVAPTAV
jgi:diguanylate cyclase (GGDEF)-like protein